MVLKYINNSQMGLIIIPKSIFFLQYQIILFLYSLKRYHQSGGSTNTISYIQSHLFVPLYLIWFYLLVPLFNDLNLNLNGMYYYNTLTFVFSNINNILNRF